jgi:hypothetical protein
MHYLSYSLFHGDVITMHKFIPSGVVCLYKGKIVTVPFLTEHHAMKAYCGSGGIAPRTLDLCTRWR